MRLWEQFLQDQEKIFGSSTINRWARPLRVLKFDACNLYLEAIDSFQLAWFEEHLRSKIKKTFVNNNGREIKVHLSLSKRAAKKESKETSPQPLFCPDKLLHYATLKQYIPSAQNLISYQILCKLCGYDPQSDLLTPPPHPEYNPVFIHGPSGTGKTHLLMAIGATLMAHEQKVFYIRAETFTEHVVAAIRGGGIAPFRQAYRNVDVLIIDDIQVLARKTATQEELFHTFNALHTSGKQMIFSADVSPRFIEDIEERLISRFEWGISLPLEKSSNADALEQILKERANFFQIELENNISDYLLHHFHSPRTLCRSIESLALFKELEHKRTMRLEDIEKHLQKLIKEDELSALTPTKIIQLVADHFGICREDIEGKSQSRDCALPRQICMYLLREELKLPYMKIGKLFSRDHSTVMTSIKQIAMGINEKKNEITSPVSEISRKLLAIA